MIGTALVRAAPIVALALVLAACDGGEQEAAAPPAPPSVTVAGVQTRDITTSARFIGQVEAVDSAELIARVEGFLEELAVADGSFVQEGALLFRIERERYEALVAQAEASAARARSDLALADIELERARELGARDTIPQSQFDEAEATQQGAVADLRAAEAHLAEAQLNLTYTEMAAPFEGRIGRTAFSRGDVVGPTKGPIATLVRLSPIYVNFSLSEGEFITILQRMGGTIRDNPDPEGDSLPISLVLPNGQALGEIGRAVFVDNQVNPETGTIAIRAQFENADGLLAPGVFTTVIVEGAQPEPRLTVPQAAIQRDQRGDFALVVGQDGNVEQRYVELGTQNGTDFVVQEGLTQGESVIVEGLQRVRPGVPVNAVGGDAPAEG